MRTLNFLFILFLAVFFLTCEKDNSPLQKAESESRITIEIEGSCLSIPNDSFGLTFKWQESPSSSEFYTLTGSRLTWGRNGRLEVRKKDDWGTHPNEPDTSGWNYLTKKIKDRELDGYDIDIQGDSGLQGTDRAVFCPFPPKRLR